MTSPRPDQGFVSRVVEAFLHGNLSVLLILVMLACGVAAHLLTPREEEPQIVVPVADVFVHERDPCVCGRRLIGRKTVERPEPVVPIDVVGRGDPGPRPAGRARRAW